MLGDGGGDAGDVGFLEGIPADQMGGHLAADHHQRDGVDVRRGDAGDHVAYAGTAGGEAHTHLPRGPGIAVGRMDRALFVTGEDVGELHPVQGIIQAQYSTSRIPKDDLDLFFS